VPNGITRVVPQPDIPERLKMEVILREHVDNLGRRGEVVKVANGYARNFLLPRKLALLVTEGNRKHVERERAKFDAKEAEDRDAAQRVADRLSGVEISIARRVGETAALYGSVTTTDIAEALAAKGYEIDRRKLQLAEAIKRIGDYEVPIKLHRDVTATLKVHVVPEGAAQS
jgi:large subunit ribosomal protein L9